jgi:hypothetical protein
MKTGRAYDVGYGRPPVKTQFKPGRSGNPAGRPRERLNLAKQLEKALLATVVVNEAGRRKRKTKFSVAITQIVNQAAGGDLVAFRLLLGLLPGTSEASLPPDLKVDRELALKIVARLTGQKPEPGSGEDDG